MKHTPKHGWMDIHVFFFFFFSKFFLFKNLQKFYKKKSKISLIYRKKIQNFPIYFSKNDTICSMQNKIK
jgi:hypothetical protein